MNTYVRIGPIEQWGESHKEHIPLHVRDYLAGAWVQIDTCSMWTMSENGETFRNWRLVGESQKWLRALMNEPFDSPPLSLCEHMLELD